MSGRKLGDVFYILTVFRSDTGLSEKEYKTQLDAESAAGAEIIKEVVYKAQVWECEVRYHAVHKKVTMEAAKL